MSDTWDPSEGVVGPLIALLVATFLVGGGVVKFSMAVADMLL